MEHCAKVTFLKYNGDSQRSICIITSAPYYISKYTLHTELKIPFVKNDYVQQYKSFFEKLQISANPFVNKMTMVDLPTGSYRRLKRRK